MRLVPVHVYMTNSPQWLQISLLWSQIKDYIPYTDLTFVTPNSSPVALVHTCLLTAWQFVGWLLQAGLLCPLSAELITCTNNQIQRSQHYKMFASWNKTIMYSLCEATHLCRTQPAINLYEIVMKCWQLSCTNCSHVYTPCVVKSDMLTQHAYLTDLLWLIQTLLHSSTKRLHLCIRPCSRRESTHHSTKMTRYIVHAWVSAVTSTTSACLIYTCNMEPCSPFSSDNCFSEVSRASLTCSNSCSN